MAQYLAARLEAASNQTYDVLYTVPTGYAINSPSLTAAHTADTAGTQTVDAAIYSAAGAYVSSIQYSAAITAAGSANIIPGIETLAAGESIRVRNRSAGNVTKAASAAIPAAATALIANSAGTTLIAVTASYGIFRSVDYGVTWTRVYTGAVAAVSHIYHVATTTFYIYLTSTTALKSTDDGATWSAQVVVAAPVYASGNSPTGRCVRNGTTYVGASTSTQLVSTTDGVNWANFGVVLTTGTIKQVTWTGTNYVVASGAAAGIYWTTDGAAWTGVSCGGFSIAMVASDGAGKVLAGVASQSLYYSTDHGATMTSTGGTALTSGTAYYAFATTTSLVCGNSTTAMDYVDIATPSISKSVVTAWSGSVQNVVAVTSARAYYMTTVLSQTYSTDMSVAKYGVSFSLSYQKLVQS